MQTDQFSIYVSDRLSEWGEYFAIHRDRISLGTPKNILQTVIEHKGEIPRSTGQRPMDIPIAVMSIEDIVRRIHGDSTVIAACLGGFYCGSGRRSVERFEKAKELAGISFSRRSFYTYHDLGFDIVRMALHAAARMVA